jgi:hypothetical protein
MMMNIEANWANSTQTIIHLTFQRGWTWDDLSQALDEADAMIGSVPHTVHLMIDIRDGGGRLPRDFITVAGELFAQGPPRANEGQRVVIGAGMMMRAAYRGLLNIYGAQLQDRPFLFASSPEEAQTLLQSVL